MTKFLPVVLILIGSSVPAAPAATLGEVTYTVPEGWSVAEQEGMVVLAPADADEAVAVVLVLYSAASLADQAFAAWLEAQMASSLEPPAKVIEAAPAELGQRDGLDLLTAVRTVQDAEGAPHIQLFHAISDGKRAALLMGIATNEQAIDKYATAIRGLLGSLDFVGRTPPAGAGPAEPPAAGTTPPTGQGEPLPKSGLVNGQPQGLFSGVSILSGNPAAILFLPGGRAYHGIPAASLNQIDWQHLTTDSSSRCSRWEMQGNTLRIIWPDGNVWESAFQPTATGFRFNGKSYGATYPVDMKHLTGTWEGTKSTAWLYMDTGPAMTQINNLQVAADGSYTWGVATVGDVGNATAYSEAAFAGKVEIDGYEAVFHAREGQSRRLSLTRWKDSDVLILGGAFYFRK